MHDDKSTHTKVAEEAPALVAVTPPTVTDPPPSPYESNMFIVTASPDKQFPSQSKPSAGTLHDPSSNVASKSKLQAFTSVQPATPHEPTIKFASAPASIV